MIDFPFVMVAGAKMQLSWQRVTEAAIIGVVLGAFGYVAVIPKLEQRLDNLQHNLERLERAVERIQERDAPKARQTQSEDWRSHKQTRCMEIAERARYLWFDLHVMGFMRESVNDSEYLKDVASEAKSDREAHDKAMGDCMGMNT